MLERASGLSFDENTVTGEVTATTMLTSTLGAEGGESEATFDDFDDYNGFSKWVLGNAITFRSADYHLTSTVDYVTVSSNQVVTSGGRTYHKRLQIQVTSPFMQDTLRFSTVYSYWYFR